MLDVNTTIYKNIIDSIGKLRYQAKDDPKRFKAILELIMLDDMMEWAQGLDEPQEDIQKLFDKKINLILCNHTIIPEYLDYSAAYVNVNTPQTNSTWKRVWDAKESEDYVTCLPGEKLSPCDEENCENPRRYLTVKLGFVKDLIIKHDD